MFIQESEQEIPPEIESQFLDNVMATEKNFSNKKTSKDLLTSEVSPFIIYKD